MQKPDGLRERHSELKKDEDVPHTNGHVLNTDEKEEEWKQCRMYGFASFVIPASIVVILSTEFIGGSKVHNTIFNTKWGWLPFQRTILYFTLWASKEVFLNLFKYILMVHVFGLSQEHFNTIIGPRSDWVGTECDEICKIYGRKRIKVMDAINRRMGHTVINIFRLVFYIYLCDTNELRLKTAMLQLPVITTLKILTESGHRFYDIGRFVFQGSRVFDGRYGRFNLVVVNFWAYAARIIMFQLLIRADLSEDTKSVIFMLAMMPMLWGDSAGEIIGSFFGRLSFQVRGLGEVNRKTVEGTLAVFVSSFLTQLYVYYIFFDLPEETAIFVYHPVIVLAYTSVIAMIVETGAPRGTDNFFLQTTAIISLLGSVR